jgi:hypothetical protein
VLDVEQLPAATLTAADVPESILFSTPVRYIRSMFRATTEDQS